MLALGNAGDEILNPFREVYLRLYRHIKNMSMQNQRLVCLDVISMCAEHSTASMKDLMDRGHKVWTSFDQKKFVHLVALKKGKDDTYDK